MAKRASGGFDKKIFGVPVFPVAKPTSNGSHSNDHSNDHGNNFNNSFSNQQQQQQQQAYNPQFRNNNILEKRDSDANNYKPPSNNYTPNNYTPNNHPSNNHSALSNLSNQWKLRHMDFMPTCVKTKKDDDYEKFSALVDKANKWSLSNPHVIVFSCETVTWTSVDRPLYTDTGVMLRSMSSDRRTKFCRGLRLWYFIFEEVFLTRSPSRNSHGGGGGGDGEVDEHGGSVGGRNKGAIGVGLGVFKLGHVTYTCDVKGETSFSQLLKKLNSDLARKAIKGKILRVETLELLSDLADVETSVWYEQPDKAKDYSWFMRVLIAYDPEEAFSGEIGVYDFIPAQDHKNPHNSGYETYEDLWRKASNHIFQNPQLTFLCVQSIFVKVKKDTETRSMTLWDKCTHCQHASSYGGLSNQRTEFLQILRLTYYKSNPIGPGRNAPPTGATGKKLFYKYFSPSPMKRPVMSPTSSPTDDQDPMTVEGLYEDLRTLEDKINAWLAFSGAKVAGVETLATRLGSGGQEMLASEATSVYNQRERNLTKEPWKVTIRLVLEGEFKEKPQAWDSFHGDVVVPGAGGIRSDF